MPRIDPIQSSFTGGEISPRLHGRVDIDLYKTGLSRCENMFVYPHGGVSKRGGTRYVAAVKDSTKTTILHKFNYRDEFQYVLEFGHNYIRFFRSHAAIGDIYELATTYDQTEVADLRFAQDQDSNALYIVHKDHVPAMLIRDAHATWRLISLNEDGIFDVTNITHGGDHTNNTYTGVALGGGTGTGAEATVVVAGNDVTSVLITDSGSGYLEADAGLTIDNATIGGAADATVDVDNCIMMNTPSQWGAANYPTIVLLYELRLWFMSTPDQPNWIWSSNTAEFNEFDLGTGLDAESIAVPLKQATKLLWAEATDVDILVGAHNGEFRISSNTNLEALTPSNIRPSSATNYGGAFVSPIRIDSDTIFLQKGLRKLRKLQYRWQTSSYVADNITLVAEHITQTGVVDMAYSNEPDSFIWMALTDGSLVSMTYDPDNKVFGCHDHPIAGTDRLVKSIAVIDGATDIAKDEVWMIVSRTINEGTVQLVEYLVPEGLSQEDTKEDAFFVDCGVTATGVDLALVNTLSHLEGETVSVLADGAVQSPKVVDKGTITISPVAAKVQAGLRYSGIIETLPLKGGNPIGSAQTKIKRVSRLALRLFRSLGFYVSDIAGTYEDVYTFGPGTMGTATDPYTGDTEEIPFPGGYDLQGRVKIFSSDPTPLTILAIVFGSRTKD